MGMHAVTRSCSLPVDQIETPFTDEILVFAVDAIVPIRLAVGVRDWALSDSDRMHDASMCARGNGRWDIAHGEFRLGYSATSRDFAGSAAGYRLGEKCEDNSPLRSHPR
jgi:hypothetical protein